MGTPLSISQAGFGHGFNLGPRTKNALMNVTSHSAWETSTGVWLAPLSLGALLLLPETSDKGGFVLSSADTLESIRDTCRMQSNPRYLASIT